MTSASAALVSSMTGEPRAYSLYVTCKDAEEAERLARAVVEEGLAACANILAPTTSIYRWEGEVLADAEVPLILKTSSETREACTERLAELHSYDLPCIVAWPIVDAHPPYLQWLTDQCARPDA